MSAFRSFFLGRGDFLTSEEIRNVVKKSKNFDELEQWSKAEVLLIFQTSKQQTWLVATEKRLYCILDDLSRADAVVTWSIGAKELITKSNLVAQITTSNKTDRTGLLSINNHRNWLYSKKLFASESIDNQIRRMILDRMS